MHKRDPVPEILRLEQLVESIRRGEVRLPKFQRPFVWDKEDILELWDSIYNGYPIGSILLWHSSERLKSEREIYGFAVNDDVTERYPTDYLLDGQQRLTSVCAALYWDDRDINSLWAVHFDLQTEKFVYAKETNLLNLFPLNKLLDTGSFIRQCMKFEVLPDARKYYENAEKLLRAVKNYKIAVVRIGDLTIDEVAPIFERINSTGRQLTMVDLMRAATWKEGFDLSSALESFEDSMMKAGFSDVPESIVLRGIAAAAGLGINKGDVDRLRTLSGERLKSAFHSAEEATISALHFLRDDIGVHDITFLPYGIQLNYLSEIFRINKNDDSNVRRELRRWFWITSITRYFSGANSGQIARDLLAARSFAEGVDYVLQPKLDRLDISDLLFSDFNLRTAASATYCLLLLQLSKPGNPLQLAPKKDREYYADFLKGGQYSGKNIGQFHRIELDGLTPSKQKGLSPDPILLSQDAEILFLQGRAKEMAGLIENLTGVNCYYDIPNIKQEAL